MCQYYCFNNSFKIFLISDTASSLSEFSATFYKNPCTFLFHSSLTISVQSPTLSLKRVMLFFRLILESSWFTMLRFCCTAKLISYTYMLSESESHSAVSDSLQPHGLYCPWNSPGQNTRVGSLFLFRGIFPTQGSNVGEHLDKFGYVNDFLNTKQIA